jgi:RNA polymerase sigma-70 factor (ECF subfamily)
MTKNWTTYLEGDNSALEELYEDLFQPLLFVSIKYTKNIEISKDIISDIFLFLLETSLVDRQEKWKEVREIGAFLTIIVKNKSIDSVRVISNRKKIEEELSINSVSNSFLEYFNTDHFEKSIAHLNEQEQQLLSLYYQGYSNVEIGEQLNYSEKTIRNKLSLTRKKLIYFWKNLIILMLWKFLN